MLFKLRNNTSISKIFRDLNNEFLYFLAEAIEAQNFSRSLFSDHLGQVIWENDPTRILFEALWNVLPGNLQDREDIYNVLSMSQNLPDYFRDTDKNIPSFSNDVFKAAKNLTSHLFGSTKDLVGVVAACGEELSIHFDEFRNLNGAVCGVCGTELLAQQRADIAPEDQWRAAYDHLLGKAEYPYFAVHPMNLVPICFTCNSKAKSTKELLIDKSQPGNPLRRVSFFPYFEGCEEIITVSLVEQELGLRTNVEWLAADDLAEVKIGAWNEVYAIKSRIEGEFKDFVHKLQIDCRARDADDLKDQIARRIACTDNEQRAECWLFWKTRLYSWIHDQGDELIEQLWAMIDSMRDDEGHQRTFGI